MTTDHGATARSVAAAALGVPGVVGLTGGQGAVIAATHYPGGTVTGVRLSAAKVCVHIVVGRLPLGPVADDVRGAVRAALEGMGDTRVVEVVVEDLDESAFSTALVGQRGLL